MLVFVLLLIEARQQLSVLIRHRQKLDADARIDIDILAASP